MSARKPDVFDRPRATRRWVNDRHSRLNRTEVAEVFYPRSLDDLCRVVKQCAHAGQAISISGARHAMGAQQFGTGTVLVDTGRLSRIVSFDAGAGTIEVEAGIGWPDLIAGYLRLQQGRSEKWGIAQKQTGADRLSLGGTLAANAHGRGLRMKPFASDVDSFVLVDAEGDLRRCSRHENADLFRLVIGGYGLFGIVSSLTLRLVPRIKLERVVEVTSVPELMTAFQDRLATGFVYGDFQFATDERSNDFMHKGVLSCYRPVDRHVSVGGHQTRLSAGQWRELIYLAHTDKEQAFERYAAHYLSTSGQVYWSDTHQLSTYLDGYHDALDRRLGAEPASEMIGEVFVPRETLTSFVEEARTDLRTRGVNVVYGTVRLIERDDETALSWARESYACIVFNLHTDHTPTGIATVVMAFRRLIDMAIARGGSYYLTYHNFAVRKQVETCHPELPSVLESKMRFDPDERFQSDWYRHHRRMLT